MESQTFDEIPRMHFPALFSNLGQIGICSPQTLYSCITKTFDFGVTPEFDAPASVVHNHSVHVGKDMHVSDAQEILNSKF